MTEKACGFGSWCGFLLSEWPLGKTYKGDIITVFAKSHQSTWRWSHHHWKLWPRRAWGPAGWGRGPGGCRRLPSGWGHPPVSHWPLWKTPNGAEERDVTCAVSLHRHMVVNQQTGHKIFALSDTLMFTGEKFTSTTGWMRTLWMLNHWQEPQG